MCRRTGLISRRESSKGYSSEGGGTKLTYDQDSWLRILILEIQHPSLCPILPARLRAMLGSKGASVVDALLVASDAVKCCVEGEEFPRSIVIHKPGYAFALSDDGLELDEEVYSSNLVFSVERDKSRGSEVGASVNLNFLQTKAIPGLITRLQQTANGFGSLSCVKLPSQGQMVTPEAEVDEEPRGTFIVSFCECFVQGRHHIQGRLVDIEVCRRDKRRSGDLGWTNVD